MEKEFFFPSFLSFFPSTVSMYYHHHHVILFHGLVNQSRFYLCNQTFKFLACLLLPNSTVAEVNVVAPSLLVIYDFQLGCYNASSGEFRLEHPTGTFRGNSSFQQFKLFPISVNSEMHILDGIPKSS
jgi:hypothetical protein